MILVLLLVSVITLTQKAEASSPGDEYVLMQNDTTSISSELVAEGTSVDSQFIALVEKYRVSSSSGNSNATTIYNYLNNIVSNIEDAILRKAMKAALSVFNFSGWDLSAELFAFSLTEHNISYVYQPINVDVIYHSDYYAQLANSTSIIQDPSFTFSLTGSKYDNDCYMSIRTFKYTKESPLSKKLNITDTYDFSNTSNGTLFGDLIQPAVDIVYRAQTLGIVTEFELNIAGEEPHSIVTTHNSVSSHSKRCSETDCNLGVSTDSTTYTCAYTRYNSTYHNIDCDGCSTVIETHTWERFRPNIGLSLNTNDLLAVAYYACKYCGEIKNA